MKKGYLVLLSLFIISACSTHSFMRGTVAMKTDKQTAHVCLGKGDVKVGDRVRFMENRCNTLTRGSSRLGSASERECTMKELGTGTVTKLLNDHYSEVKTEGEFSFKEGSLVQKF